MDFNTVSSGWIANADPAAFASNKFYQNAASSTRKLETARKKALERKLTLQKAVCDIEEKLEVIVRWTPGSDEWESTEILQKEWDYWRIADHLEECTVSRMFELTKLHQSGVGKLRYFGFR
jgi:hypothetical protein